MAARRSSVVSPDEVPLEMVFNVGDRVRTAKDGDGTVQYFGPHKGGKPGLYVGIELDNPLRNEVKTDVPIKEIKDTYFSKKPNCGVMLLAAHVELIDRKAKFKVGDLVQCARGMGTVEYYGPHARKAWYVQVGIALLEKTGKHDGTVEGHPYFSCTPGHGMLLHEDKVEMLQAGFKSKTEWHQREFLKVHAEAASAQADEIRKDKEDEEKVQRQLQKDRLISRYKPASDADSAPVPEPTSVPSSMRRSSGADTAPVKVPKDVVREGDALDEFDPQAQYAASKPHMGTIRRKVGSRTYLFEQVNVDQTNLVKSNMNGSLSGMYVEVAKWTFWNKASAKVYMAKWKEVIQDDRAAEAYCGFFEEPSTEPGAEVTYIVLSVGTCQQYVNLYGKGNAYHLIEESMGIKYEDRVKAKQMAKQNGMKAMKSHVYTVKGHADLHNIASQWNDMNKTFSCTIVEHPGVAVVGGWRTVASFCKKQDWVAVLGSYEFDSSQNKDTFFKEAERLSAEPTAKVQGVEREKMRAQIEPVAINHTQTDTTCVTVGLYNAAIWANQAPQGLDKVTVGSVVVLGPGTAADKVASKVAGIKATKLVTCVALTETNDF